MEAHIDNFWEYPENFKRISKEVLGEIKRASKEVLKDTYFEQVIYIYLWYVWETPKIKKTRLGLQCQTPALSKV